MTSDADQVPKTANDQHPPALPLIPMLVRLGLTLLIGTIGGWLLSQFRIPLAWMLGAMIATMSIALAGGQLERPIRLRVIMLAVLGVMLGSTFTPAVLHSIPGWINTLSAMTIFALLVTIIGFIGLRRLLGFDQPTAFFSAVPGGLTDMVITGGAMGGDDRSIALIHSVRIMLTVLIIPFWFRFAEGVAPVNTASAIATIGDVSISDGLMLAMAGIGGVLLARIIRIPAYALIGPMVASMSIHLAGFTTAKPPIELVNTAQVVVGASIGCRFIGVSIRQIPETLAAAVITGLYMLAAAALAALLLESLTGISFAALWLAFAPGGLPEMALMSIALGVDPAFVSTHHLYRVILLVVLAPLFYRLYRRLYDRWRDQL